MLSINSSILKNDIAEIGCLAPRHPVYLLKGWSDDSIVIKQESGNFTANDFNRNARIMAAVDSHTRPKPLQSFEINELKQWVASGLGDPDPAINQVLQEMQTFFSLAGVWTKMPALRVADLDHAIGDKDMIRKIAAALNAPGGLEKLGEITAADLFNGNKDRFYYNSTMLGHKSAQCNNQAYWHLANVGNILFATNGAGELKIVGLDAFDPNSPYRDWNKSLRACEESGAVDGQWPGRLLGPGKDTELATFAKRCVEDLNQAMGARNRTIPFATKNRLDKTAQSRFLAGIKSGAIKIQNKLVAHYRGHTKPIGIVERVQAVGWSKLS